MEMDPRAYRDIRKGNLKSNFNVESTLQPFYKGGQVLPGKDGKHLYCMCGPAIKIVETATGSVTCSLGELDDTDEFTAFTLSPDNSLLVASSRSGLLRCWDCNSYSLQRTWKSTHIGPVSRLALHQNSVLLASGGADGTVKVWDLVKKFCTHSLTDGQGLFSVVEFHPEMESDLLFGAADDCKIHVWSLTTKKISAQLTAHYSPVTCLDFTPDHKHMISSGRDRVVFVWDLVKFSVLKTVAVFEEVESVLWCTPGRDIPGINVSSEDLHFLTAGNKGILRAWNVGTASPVYSQEEQEKLPHITSAHYSPALDSVVVVTHEHNILLYKLQDLSLSKQLIGNSEEVTDMELFGEKESHLVVATNSPLIKVFELATQDCQLLEGHTDLVLSLSVFPEKPFWFASCAKDSSVRIWQMHVETQVVTCMFTGLGHTQNVTAVACCRSGSSFVVSGSADLTIKLWKVPEKQRLVVINPTLTSEATVRAHEKEINSIDVAPNNLLLATGSQDKTAKIWKTETVTLCGTLRGHRKGIWCVQFSPVDQVIATSSADGTIKIWALSDYSCAKTFEGHCCSVLKFHFLSRGMQLLSSGSDGLIKLWTVKTNECMKTFDGHDDKVWALALSKNEERFVSGGSDAKIIYWKDVTQQELEESLEKQHNLILLEQEIQTLLHERKWLKALTKAIHLDQPHRCLNILKEILLQGSADADLHSTLKGLNTDQTRTLLRYCQLWNMNSKHCAPAQAVLNTLFRLWTPEELLRLQDIRQVVEGLLPYTERHFQRLTLLEQQGTFVNYLYNSMRISVCDNK